MRRTWISALGLVFAVAASALAVDLTKIERAAVKLPQLRSDAPEYCLLVFGPEAAKQVWLVHDGDVLYVDRNSNGDLTEPDERVAADPKTSKPAERVFSFAVGAILDGPNTHKGLAVHWAKVNHMKDVARIYRDTLERNPQFRGCSISVDVALDGYRGTGIEGRVPQMATFDDEHGLLQFAARIEDAPIIHFGGPWQITVTGQPSWRVGRNNELYLVIGTPGLGPGTTACMAYEKVIPRELSPRISVTFHLKDKSPVTKSYDLKRRCCTINLYGDVAVPDDVSTGRAKLEISFDSWLGGKVAPTTHEAMLLPVAPGPKPEPVSARLASKLEHSNRTGSPATIRFSEDGNRLIAGDYPGGVVHVWDLGSGSRLQTIDCDAGLRGSTRYYEISPDWSTIIAPTNSRGKFDRVERDGKSLHRVEFDNALRVWDLNTGELRHTWQDTPARGMRSMNQTPDGKYLFLHEELPGEFESQRPGVLSLWNVATGEHRTVVDHRGFICAISPDSKRAAVSVGDSGLHHHESLAVFSVPEWTPVLKIPLGSRQNCHGAYFVPGTDMLAFTVVESEKENEFENLTGTLKFWSLAENKELFSLTAPNKGENFAYVKASPDGRTIATSTFNRQPTERHFWLIDLATRAVKILNYGPDDFIMEAMFHPSGKWMAIPIRTIPKEKQRLRDAPATEFPQPRFQLVDVATGAILETMISPPAHLMSMAFSPDGNTLATTGTGEVLLWNMRTPPGAALAGPAVGDTFAAEGTLIDGQDLDWATYQGQAVLVVFWATWCKPCVAEIPAIKSVYEKYRDAGFQVVGISLDEDQSKVAQFVKEQEVPWPVVCGTSTENSGARQPTALKYHVESVPKAYLVDRDGKVAAIDVHGDELSAAVEKLVRTK